MTTTLQGTMIDNQPYVLVPLKTLMALLGKNAPVKLLMPPTQSKVVIVPPAAKSEMELSEAEFMDAKLKQFRDNGLPSWVVPYEDDERLIGEW